MATHILPYLSGTHVKLCHLGKRMCEKKMQDFVFPFLCERVCVCLSLTRTGLADFRLLLSFLNSGSIVSVGDPKKKYTRFEKIGQG